MIYSRNFTYVELIIFAKILINGKIYLYYEGDIILIYSDSGKVSEIECKDILASVYGIDKTLSLDEFMTQYFAKLTQIETSEINETSDKS